MISAATKLKRVASLTAGGTPSVDEPEYWDEDNGVPWVSIGDMSDGLPVETTSRHVSAEGVRSKRLPSGRPGTLLFAMYASVGAVGELAVHATWNQALLGIQPVSGLADSRFIRHWLEHLRPTLSALSRSNTQDNLNAEQVGNFPFPVTSIEEQRAIADYLDTETARIDALITKKRRLITLLEECWWTWLRSLLLSTEAPHAPLKRGWSVVDCKHRTPTYVDDGYPVISPGDTTPGRLDLSRAHRFVEEADLRALTGGGRRPRRGDIIYSRNASIGIASYVDTDSPFCMGQDVCLITSRSQSQLYLMYVLNSLGTDQLNRLKLGSTFSRVNVAQILELQIPMPPSDEQHRIAAMADAERARLDAAITGLQRQVSLLDERRQALITAAVTGEIDVPAAV